MTPPRRSLPGRCRWSTDRRARAGAGSAAAGSPRAATRARAHAGAGVARTGAAPASTARWRSSARPAVADHARPRVGPSITQNSSPGGSDVRSAVQPVKTDHAQGVHPDLATPVTLPMPDQQTPSPLVQVRLGQRERLMDPQTGSPQHNDHPPHPPTVTTVCGVAHEGDDLIDRGRIRRVPVALVRWDPAGAMGGHRRRRARATGGVQQTDKQAWLPPLESGLVCCLLELKRPGTPLRTPWAVVSVDPAAYPAGCKSDPNSAPHRLYEGGPVVKAPVSAC